MSTFSGYFNEFEGLIRADHFGQATPRPPGCTRATVLYLLSHCHVDHLTGLEHCTNHPIYCSAVTRDIVPNLSTATARVEKEVGIKDELRCIRKYSNLNATIPGRGNRSSGEKDGQAERVDLLKPLPLNTPTIITLQNGEADNCCITLIDANHCPGAVMFLIQMWGKSVLYTGDIRAEKWWVEGLCKMPILQPFLGSLVGPKVDKKGKGKGKLVDGEEGCSYRPLDCIYLDTSGLLCKSVMPSKDEAVEATIKLIELYPDDTIFFLNTWTWGYENLLERVALHFNTKIHLDSYKKTMFSRPSFSLNHPLLHTLGTKSETTRFHACERRFRCRTAWGSGHGAQPPLEYPGVDKLVEEREEWCKGKRVVTVNPWEIEMGKWRRYRDDTVELLLEAGKKGWSGDPGDEGDPWPEYIMSPIGRHSSFPELHHLVSIFKPLSLFPNTMYPSLDYLDYHYLAVLFSDVLHSDGVERISNDAIAFQKAAESRKPPHLRNKAEFVLPTDGKLLKQFRERLFRTEMASDPHFQDDMWNMNFAGSEKARAEAKELVEGRREERGKEELRFGLANDLKELREESDDEGEVGEGRVDESSPESRMKLRKAVGMDSDGPLGELVTETNRWLHAEGAPKLPIDHPCFDHPVQLTRRRAAVVLVTDVLSKQLVMAREEEKWDHRGPSVEQMLVIASLNDHVKPFFKKKVHNELTINFEPEDAKDFRNKVCGIRCTREEYASRFFGVTGQSPRSNAGTLKTPPVVIPPTIDTVNPFHIPTTLDSANEDATATPDQPPPIPLATRPTSKTDKRVTIKSPPKSSHLRSKSVRPPHSPIPPPDSSPLKRKNDAQATQESKRSRVTSPKTVDKGRIRKDRIKNLLDVIDKREKKCEEAFEKLSRAVSETTISTILAKPSKATRMRDTDILVDYMRKVVVEVAKHRSDIRCKKKELLGHQYIELDLGRRKMLRLGRK